MSYANWHVGMDVVCVKKGAWNRIDGPEMDRPRFPLYGEVCIISRLEMHETDGLHIGLMGFDPQALFHASRFRPVEKRAADISIFTAMLTGQKVDA